VYRVLEKITKKTTKTSKYILKWMLVDFELF